VSRILPGGTLKPDSMSYEQSRRRGDVIEVTVLKGLASRL
jgi:hypothetical protein